MSLKQDKTQNSQQKLIIGTANFGQRYGGVSDFLGLSKDNSNEILKELELINNVGLDTSPQYGISENIVGDFLKSSKFKGPITSKIPKEFYSDSKQIFNSAKISLNNLGVDSIENFLLHGFDLDLFNNSKSIFNGLQMIIDSGLSQKVGLSCYTEEEVISAKRIIPSLTVFQIPECIIDQRKKHSQAILQMNNEGNEFIVRSIFLQGNLLKQPEMIPEFLLGIKSSTQSVSRLANKAKLSNLEICVAYAKSIEWASSLLFGVDSFLQLKSINAAFLRTYEEIDFNVRIADEKLIDPRKWKN
jgi:aryl-alcohol dehydrogenase-like predicted oxidoreductase